MKQPIHWWRIFGVVLILLGSVSIIVPVVSSMASSSIHPFATESHLNLIAKANLNYKDINSPPHFLEAKPTQSAHYFAYILAKAEGLNDASLYILKSDHLAPKSIPKTVLDGAPGPNARINPDFLNATLSFEFAANLPLNTPVTTTPLAWTRGLRPDGTWAPDSPWEGQGGHILFLDGHVEWFDRLKLNDPNGAYFYKYGTYTQTINIHEALPPGAVILSAKPPHPAAP